MPGAPHSSVKRYRELARNPQKTGLERDLLLDGPHLLSEARRSGLVVESAAFGSTVNLREDNGDSITYQLVMPEEADAAKGLISTSSPIGRAIVGRTEGDAIQVTTPSGTRNFEIVKLVTIHDEA